MCTLTGRLEGTLGFQSRSIQAASHRHQESSGRDGVEYRPGHLVCIRTSEMSTEGGAGCVGRGQRRQEELCALWPGTVGSQGRDGGQNALKTSLSTGFGA